MTGDPAGGSDRRRNRWLIGAAAFAAVFIAALLINAVDESQSSAPDMQALLMQADAQQVVVCGVVTDALAPRGAGRVTLSGPRASTDPGDTAVVVIAQGEGPATAIPAGTSVEVSATVHVRAGSGSAEIAELVQPTGFQRVRSCPGEVVPLSS
jgi:hypothetical protein